MSDKMSYQYPPTSNEQGSRATTAPVSLGHAWENDTIDPALLIPPFRRNLNTNNVFTSELTPTASDTRGFVGWQWPGGSHADWSFDSFNPESVPAPEMEWNPTYDDGGVSVHPDSRAQGALPNTEQAPLPYPKGFPVLVEKTIQAGKGRAEILTTVKRELNLKWDERMLEDAYQEWDKKFESTGLTAWHDLPETIRNKLEVEGIHLDKTTIEGKFRRFYSRVVVKR